jgi:peptide/nickel transport system substrate-binding protein
MPVLLTRRSSHPSPRRGLALFRCLLCAALIAGCRASADPGPGRDHVTIGVSIPRLSGSEKSAATVGGSMLRDSGVAFDENGHPVARIFDAWEWREHGRALQLHLRANILFHDGTPLTAALSADIIRDYLEDPEQLHVSSVESVTAPDASHVLIRTARQEGLLLAELSMIDVVRPGAPGIGTGPFKLTADPATLEAFDQYYLGAPTLKRVRFADYPSQRAAWVALMRGDIDMLHEVTPEAVEFVKAESRVTPAIFLRPYTDSILFNVHHPILSRREVRVALNEAVDRAAIVRVSMRGLGKPASDPIWPLHWAYSTAVPDVPYDPAHAMTLLDTAGLAAGRLREPGRMPSRFAFKCLVLENEPSFNRIALRVQRQLYEIGVDMEVVPVKPRQMGEALHSGNFDAVLMEFATARSLNMVYVMWHSPQPGIVGTVPSGYRGADDALDRFRAATDDAEIRASVEGLQRVFRNDPPAMFIAWPQRARALSKAFAFPEDGSGDILATIRLWRSVPGATRAVQ